MRRFFIVLLIFFGSLTLMIRGQIAGNATSQTHLAPPLYAVERGLGGEVLSFAAQDSLPLTAQDVTIAPQVDLYGQEVLYAEGTLLNEGQQAYTGISLLATGYDAGGEAVAEGFGYLVNACGAGLLPDFALQPGAAQFFAVPLELFEDEVEIDRVEVSVQGIETEPTAESAELPRGITQVTNQEIARLEWIDADNLRYGVGCFRDVFTDYQWYDYNLDAENAVEVAHPKAEFITEALLRQLGLLDPSYLRHSLLSYAPNARRMVYQTELNVVITAEPDGSFKRVLFESLSSRTLQGFTWLEEGRFLAYYYGAYGDPVTYFTATVDGQTLSESAPNSIPSLVTPGASPDGDEIIIAAEVDGVTGFYRKQAAYPTTELLFEAEIPGNNWPGPLVEQDADGAQFIYTALPTEDGAALVCFNRETGEQHDLSPLPLNLATDERAWWSLAPGNETIALYANGINGGLWLIDLNTVGNCA